MLGLEQYQITPSGSSVGGAVAQSQEISGSSHSFDFLAPRFRARRHLQGTNHAANWMSQSARNEAKKNGLLFVSDESKNVVDVFPKNRATSPIGTISSEVSTPVGLAVDGGGNLYVVANLGNSTVTEYAPPYTSGPLATYSSGLASPTQVAVGVDGTVYVAEFVNDAVVEFPPGSMSPALTLALGQEPEGVALDASNNLYVVSEVPSGVGEIAEYAPGSSSGTNLGISIRFPGPLTFDAAGDIVVSAQTLPGVLVFPPGATSPSQIINDGFNDPFGSV